MKSVERILRNSDLSRNIVTHHISELRPAETADFPDRLTEELRELLQEKGIKQLYTHQRTAVDKILNGKNVIISTGVDSGKSLCYQLPILQRVMHNPDLGALFLFPTKALSQDQKSKLSELLISLKERTDSIKKVVLGIYDGDTPRDQRKKMMEKTNFLFSNPDMLHLGILPHHPKWAGFFRNLKYIIIDEAHIYRGIFGSHFANVIRRLKRIAAFYQTKLQFIITSATLSNAAGFIYRLIEENCEMIEHDGSPQGEKHFLVYNPPIVNYELGIRRSVLQEAVRIVDLLLAENSQSLIFTQSRRLVELLVVYLQKNHNDPSSIHGYRSGYLPSERREIEKKFRFGKIKTVVATNALELGIDIGGLDNVIICGYPGSIASTRQQSGRAGRKGRSALTLLIVSSGLLDQYIAENPEYLWENSPEEALINPDNPLILLHHIKCAVFEIPFLNTESFGTLSPSEINQYLDLLHRYGTLYSSNQTYYWKSENYPANEISLRTLGAREYILLSNGKSIGIVDEGSAFWLTHPQAVYIHDGEPFLVSELDQKEHLIKLEKQETDYFTQAQRKTAFRTMKLKERSKIGSGFKYFGQIKVIDRVTGFKKMKWNTNEILGYEKLELPPTELVTYGYWFSFSEDFVKKLETRKIWNNKQNDYGAKWKDITLKTRKRDNYTCQHCGLEESGSAFDVHHKKPFRSFLAKAEANRSENLVTLCKACHQAAEKQLYIQSGLAGISHLIRNIAPVFLMCDRNDIRVQAESRSELCERRPAAIVFDSIPGGIGLSEKLFVIHNKLLREALSVVKKCKCQNGCPACTGPVTENGFGAKNQVLEILKEVVENCR